MTPVRAGQIVNLMIGEGLVEDRGPGGLLLTRQGERLRDGEPGVEITWEVDPR